ncbi:MAG: hypothetical protein AB7Q17_03080 [Phycisphaerae bacterium]
MRVVTGVLLVVIGAAVAVGQSSTDMPEALVQADLARTAIRTARIDWSIRWPTLAGDEGERTHFRTWRSAGDRYLQEQWGDDEGVFRRGEGYEPLGARFQNPEATLWMDGAMWQHEARAVQARVWNAERRALFQLFDFRRIGLHPVDLYETVDALNRKAGLPPVQYESEMERDRFHVRGRLESGDVDWWIDPTRDWNVVRSRIAQPDGTAVCEQEYELRRFDGRWFPARILTYAGAKASGRISRDIRVLAAEFDRPEHPQVLTPESIGIEPGTLLQYMLLDPPTAAPVWDGSAVVSITEFYDRVRAGEAALGPTLLRERARVVARSERLARVEAASAGVIERVTWRDIDAAWERYTRQFVERYRLEAKQSEQAWRVCEDCQRQAREFIDRNREKLEARDRAGGSPAIAAAAASGDATATDGAAPGDATAADGGASGNASAADRAASDAATHAAPKRRDELLGRIDEIFDKRLKARLETIPTGAQREAAAKLPPIPEPRLLSVNAENAARTDQGARAPR